MKLVIHPSIHLALVFLAGAAPLARGQQCTKATDAELVANDGVAGDRLGRSVALDGDTVIVGTMEEGVSGSAYVFVRSGGVWTQQAKLVPPTPQAGEAFGFSVGVSGDTAVIGAPFRDTAAGSSAGVAFVFIRIGPIWQYKTMLSPSDVAGGHHFGGSVAIDGNRIAAGASSGNHPSGPGGGAAYVYHFVNLPPFGNVWALDQKIVPGDIADSFGHSLAIKGAFLAVGAPHSDTSAGASSGAIYVFERDASDWTQDVKLQGSVGSGDNLGASVQFDGSRVAAIAFGDDTIAPYGGAAHVFRKQNLLPPSTAHFWMSEGKLVNPDVVMNASFASSVALTSGKVHYATGLPVFGYIWTWEKQPTWVATIKTRAYPSQVADELGFAMAGEGNDLFATAMGRTVSGNSDQGAAFWIDMSYPGICTPQTYCTAKVTSNGCTPSIAAQGMPSSTLTSNFFVKATNLRNNRPGLLLYTVNGGHNAAPFQGGILCVGPSAVRRTVGVGSGGSPAPANDCSGVFSLDMNAFANGALGGNPDAGLVVLANEVQAQWWGRDPGFAPPNNTMLSNAIEWIVGP